MNFKKVAKNYLRELHAALSEAQVSGQATPELSFRPPLHNFFESIADFLNPNIKITFEPRKQAKAGRPDWRFHDSTTLGIYGYCEAKAVSVTKEIDLAAHTDQLSNYSTLHQPVIVTDGIEFVFLDKFGNISKHISLVTKPLKLNELTTKDIDPLLENALRTFFSAAIPRSVDEQELVEECALRATNISTEIRDLVVLPLDSGLTLAENKTIKNLKKLQASLTEHQDTTLKSAEAFSNFVAQVLVFGLIYAHRAIANSADSANVRFKNIHAFWADIIYREHSKILRPFRALVHDLGSELDENSLGPLGTWYNDCRLMLAHVNLTSCQTASPDYHILFERFLSAYDPNTRFSFGAFYTPAVLAQFAVRITTAIAQIHGRVPALLVKGHRIIDPCFGTGSFIEQLLRICSPDKKCAAEISGLEILPGPYALAHYRLRMLGHPSYPTSVKLYLTDTLSDQLNLTSKNRKRANDFAREQADARKSSSPPLTLVIGNPPSIDSEHQNDRAVDNQNYILKLVDDWRPPARLRTGRQNTQKQLTNDFVKFFRWACSRLPNDGTGMVCFVLPSSFASKPTYKFARKWLIKFFGAIWIFELDADSRRGVANSSLFSTLQGRLLFVGLRRKKSPAMPQVWHSSIVNLDKSAKLNFLADIRTPKKLLALFDLIVPQSPKFNFIPEISLDDTNYQSFWPLCDKSKAPSGSPTAIFSRSCSAIKLAPSALFTHIDRQVLIRKLAFVADLKNTFEAITDKWFSGQQKRPKANKITPKLRSAIAHSLKNKNIISRYSYRPFVSNYVLADNEVLKHLAEGGKVRGGGGARFRPEIGAAFADERTFGISITPAPDDVGDNIHRFVSFCWHLPDNDLAKRGNGRICCNWFPYYKKRASTWDSSLQSNIHPALRKRFAECLNLNEVKAADSVVFYSYAILCSTVYYKAFEGRLRDGIEEEWPRIPISAKKDVIRQVSDLGEQLAVLENPSAEIKLRPTYEKILGKFPGEFFLLKGRIDENEGCIKLYAKSSKLPVLVIRPVSDEVLNFKVSGYNPIQQWLKIHTQIYSRKQFGANDLRELCELLERISEQIDIVDQIDAHVTQLITDSKGLFSHNNDAK